MFEQEVEEFRKLTQGMDESKVRLMWGGGGGGAGFLRDKN